MQKGFRSAFRVGLGVAGTAALVGAIALLPAAGPGWGILTLGIALLVTEFTWARRISEGALGVKERIFGPGRDPSP